uniref:hypothetical protein n=1 Tax=Herbidospora sakaeratensis TaxID=564415 RepID=UPI0007817CE7|nr:hypothetical protein [Herbidospora sakaeratensis]
MSEVADRDKAQRDLLWGMYTDTRAHARHAETLRANAVNIVIVVSSAMVAVITSTGGEVNRDDLPLTLLLVLVGFIGLAFAAAYTELYHRNRLRAEWLRAILDERFFAMGDPTITEALAASDKRHQGTRLYRWSRRLTGSTHRFWRWVPILVFLAGVGLTAIALRT